MLGYGCDTISKKEKEIKYAHTQHKEKKGDEFI